MLSWLGSLLEPLWGPFRLLESFGLLIVLGLYGGFFVTFLVLPRLFGLLPRDRGKAVPQGELAKGKPTASGIVFISVFIAVALVVVPWGAAQAALLGLTALVMLSGYFDDRSTRDWGEYTKAVLDLVLAAAASAVLVAAGPPVLWVPFTSQTFVVPAWVFVPLSVVVIWVSINSTNCSDGVDGVSGTLVIMALLALGAVFYLVLGNARVAAYLLLPFHPDGAKWAVLVFTLAGCLAAYLWYNANPSKVLMGDAGSRPLGFVLGVLVMASGNPFLLLLTATVLLVNGGTGLVKVALLRFLKIRIFHNTRFPLHDHVRQKREWSNAQVLVKFGIVQLLITLGLLSAFFKIR